MVRFAAPAGPPGMTGTGECRSTEVTRGQAEVLAAHLRELGWDVTTSCGLIEGADEPCDSVLFQDQVLGVVLFTRGCWVMGEIAPDGVAAFTSAVSVLTPLLEERFGWVMEPQHGQ